MQLRFDQNPAPPNQDPALSLPKRRAKNLPKGTPAPHQKTAKKARKKEIPSSNNAAQVDEICQKWAETLRDSQREAEEQ